MLLMEEPQQKESVSLVYLCHMSIPEPVTTRLMEDAYWPGWVTCAPQRQRAASVPLATRTESGGGLAPTGRLSFRCGKQEDTLWGRQAQQTATPCLSVQGGRPCSPWAHQPRPSCWPLGSLGVHRFSDSHRSSVTDPMTSWGKGTLNSKLCMLFRSDPKDTL